MPGWTADELLGDIKVDAFIKLRSMMEITSVVIKDYLKVIRNFQRGNGLFTCINRYMKLVMTQSKNREITYEISW